MRWVLAVGMGVAVLLSGCSGGNDASTRPVPLVRSAEPESTPLPDVRTADALSTISPGWEVSPEGWYPLGMTEVGTALHLHGFVGSQWLGVQTRQAEWLGPWTRPGRISVELAFSVQEGAPPGFVPAVFVEDEFANHWFFAAGSSSSSWQSVSAQVDPSWTDEEARATGWAWRSRRSVPVPRTWQETWSSLTMFGLDVEGPELVNVAYVANLDLKGLTLVR